MYRGFRKKEKNCPKYNRYGKTQQYQPRGRSKKNALNALRLMNAFSSFQLEKIQ